MHIQEKITLQEAILDINTKLKEVDAQTLNPSIIPTSSKASITENGDKYQTINNDNRVYNINLNFDSLNDNKKKDR